MYLTKIGLSLLLLLLIVSHVLAVDVEPWPEEYTILCSSEKSTGFNWRNGDWHEVQFKNTQRLIVKPLIPDLMCQYGKGTHEDDIHYESSAGIYELKRVCLNVGEVGENITMRHQRFVTNLMTK